jgi:hypothetical protein
MAYGFTKIKSLQLDSSTPLQTAIGQDSLS